MKIRFDFVTNSSSTSFSLAAIEVVQVVVGSTLIAQAVYAASEAAVLAGVGGVVGVGGVAGGTVDGGAPAQAMSSGEKFHFSESDTPDMLVMKEALITQDLLSYRKQYGDISQNGDLNDPAVQKSKADNEAYLDYLQKKLDEIAARKFNGILSKTRSAAEETLKNEWLAKKSSELAAASDEKMFLQAEIAKAEAAGKDAGTLKELLRKVEAGESGIRQKITAEGAEPVEFAQQKYGIGEMPSEACEAGTELEEASAEKARELDEMNILKKNSALMDQNDMELLRQRSDAIGTEMGEIRENQVSWDYISGKAGISSPAAASPIGGGTDAIQTFTSTTSRSMKAIYSGAKKAAEDTGISAESFGAAGDGTLSPEIIRMMQKGIANFLRKKIGGKYGVMSSNLFKIGDLTAQGALDALEGGGDIWGSMGMNALTGTLDILKSDMLSNSFSSLKGMADTKKGMFNWRGMLKYIRDRKPLEKAVKKDFRNKPKQAQKA